MIGKKAKIIVVIAVIIIFALVQASAGQPRVEKVVVTGTGLNEQGAIKNAAKAAIQQVVGMYVVSDTLMKNRKLIKDEVLSHSNAYIRSFKILNKNVDEDGLHEVEASVEVETGKVVKSLKDLNIATKGSIETEEFVAKITAKKTGAKEFKDLVSKVIIKPFKNQKKIWDLRIHSFDQLEEYDGIRRFISGDSERLENFELTPFRIVFSIKLNDDYLDAAAQLCEHSSKEAIPYYKSRNSSNSSKNFYVYFAEINDENKVNFKVNKTYIFSSYQAKVLKQLREEIRLINALLRISILNKAGALQKSAYYWDGAMFTDSYKARPATELSGSEQLEGMHFNYSKKKSDWGRGLSYIFHNISYNLGAREVLFGIDSGNNYLYLIKNQIKISAVIYLNSQDIADLGSLQIELKPVTS